MNDANKSQNLVLLILTHFGQRFMVKQIGNLHATVADIPAEREVGRNLNADRRVAPAKQGTNFN